MSRAAFLPTPGDPFLLKLWFKYYKRWCREVDRLYVYVNSDSPREVIEYIQRTVEAFGNTMFIYTDRQIEHGEVLKRLTELATEDYIMFVEDDGFIFKPGKVDACFRRIESGEVDIVGSKRGSCSLWLYQAASLKFGIDNTGYGDNGPNFWPNFFFCKRADLMRTSRQFAAKSWNEGDRILPLGVKAPEFLVSDTFVNGSLELRALGLRVAYENQYHGNTDDEPDYDSKRNIWDGEAAWLHVGSLSSGFHGMLKPDHKIDTEHFSTEAERLELERRVAFYFMALEASQSDNALNTVKAQYNNGLQQLIKGYTLSTSRIAKRIAIYKEVMGW
jgi:hypothetical protein